MRGPIFRFNLPGRRVAPLLPVSYATEYQSKNDVFFNLIQCFSTLLLEQNLPQMLTFLKEFCMMI